MITIYVLVVVPCGADLTLASWMGGWLSHARRALLPTHSESDSLDTRGKGKASQTRKFRGRAQTCVSDGHDGTRTSRSLQSRPHLSRTHFFLEILDSAIWTCEHNNSYNNYNIKKYREV